jgi:predicted acylesterase/phospholipase RssA
MGLGDEMRSWMIVGCVALAGCATERSGAIAKCDAPYATFGQADVMAADGEPLRIKRLPREGEDDKNEIIVRASPDTATSETLLASLKHRVKVRAGASIPQEFRALLLSTGGGWGAFGAGFMQGMADGSDIVADKYDLVTGSSTGAIIAPFAYLGEKKDYAFASRIYREILTDEATLKRRNLLSLLNANAIYDNRRMHRLVEKIIHDEMIVERVKTEHGASKRVLAVSAVNMDTGQTEIFDLTAIAAGPGTLEEREEMFAQAILASAAIPIAFEPIFMKNGCMYLDSGVRQQLFMSGELVNAVVSLGDEPGKDPIVGTRPNRHGGNEFFFDYAKYNPEKVAVRVDMLVNGAATVKPSMTKLGLRPEAMRALPLLLNQSMWASIDRGRQMTVLMGWTLNYRDAAEFPSSDPGSVFSLSGKVFDQTFMVALNDYGQTLAKDPKEGWKKVPGSPDILSPGLRPKPYGATGGAPAPHESPQPPPSFDGRCR